MVIINNEINEVKSGLTYGDNDVSVTWLNFCLFIFDETIDD